MPYELPFHCAMLKITPTFTKCSAQNSEETLNTNYFPNCMIYYQMTTSIKTIFGYILCIK